MKRNVGESFRKALFVTLVLSGDETARVRQQMGFIPKQEALIA